MSIKIKNLYKNYKGFEAVKNLNFEIKKGSITGLLGPNGCGKTTTIGMILGLIRPTKGEVLINNKDIEIEKNRILFPFNDSLFDIWLGFLNEADKVKYARVMPEPNKLLSRKEMILNLI